MEILDGMRIDEIICVRLDYGDDFLKCMEEVARAKDIQTGVIVSGIGTFDRARIHYITHTGFPGEDKIVELEGPIELASMDGIIADYTPHLHCSMAVRGELKLYIRNDWQRLRISTFSFIIKFLIHLSLPNHEQTM